MMGQIHVTNPRYVIVVSGGCCAPKRKTLVIGGWAYVCSCITNVQKISLELMTLIPKCEDVETSLGVPLSVTATAQVKIMKNKDLLKLACEQFLGYDIDEIEYAIRSTLEGHLRSILGTLTVEEVYKDRDKFASLVREVAAPDIGRMGVEIISFTIKDITDKVGYLASLGKAQTAIVKRDASIGVAAANRDAGIKEAEAEKAAMDFKYMTDSKIGKNTNTYNVHLSEFEREIQTAKAEAALAYELQSNILTQEIRESQIRIEIMERKKLTEIEKLEVSRKELELNGLVRLPAEAEGFKLETVGEGVKNEMIKEASGEAEKMKLLGEAEAHKSEVTGLAEALRMDHRAKIFKKYNPAAKLSIVVDSLPQLAAKVSAPMYNIDEILVLGQTDDILNSINKLLGQVPPSVRTIAGVDVLQVLKSRMSSKNRNGKEEKSNEGSTKKNEISSI